MSLRRPGDQRQGIFRFVMKLGEQEDVTARAGLPLVVETMRALGLDEVAREELPPPERQSEYPAEDKLEAIATLIAAGGDRLEDIQVLREDKGLARLMERQFPSPDALLDFLRSFHDPECTASRPANKKAFVPVESSGLLGLEAINRALVARGCDGQTTTATIDHDGTIIESHRREATWAYDGTPGFQPLVAVWAEEQLIVADEFRDGNVAGGEDPLSSVQRAFGNLPAQVKKRYFRGDSADYYQPLLKYLVNEKIFFSISADMSPQLRACCERLAPGAWTLLETRAREQVHLGEVEFASGDWPKTAAPLRYVALRLTPLQEELFEEPSPKYLAVVTNRPAPVENEPPQPEQMTAGELVGWHWEKAGTIEHVHRSMKDELGAGVVPSGRFQMNAAWFRINAITFNVLTVLKRRALPERYRLARPKRLRYEVFTLPGKLAVHQSELSVRVSACESRAREIIAARQKLLAMLQAREAAGQTPS
jgi:hypothetical protein